MRADVLGLDPATYRPHPLHAGDRVWTETNCAADMWIECLHSLGRDPVAGLGFTLGTDFDGEQWRMFSYPAETLRSLYGIGVDELNVWRPLRRHVADQLSLGNLVAFDVDAWLLPDTAGLTYRCAHQKTTILTSMVDTGTRRLGYLHNTGYHELGGEDFDAVLPGDPAPEVMPPFTLQVRVGRHPGQPDAQRVRQLAAAHLDRRPPDNPVRRMAERAASDVVALREEGLDAFHRWAFGTVRQCGANAELAASLARRLGEDGLEDARGAAADLGAVAEGMKAAEMALARAVRGREVDVEALFAPLAARWEAGLDLLAAGVQRGDVGGPASPVRGAPSPALVAR
jgi:Domain of unknown function (DUF1839)